jgi:signal transduction histidine kinase
LRVLVIEDDRIFQKIIQTYLHQASACRTGVVLAGSLADGLGQLAGEGVDAVLLDLSLPDSDGLETLERFQEGAPEVPVIVLTGLDDEEVAAEAVRRGAQDFLVKSDLNASILTRSVRYAIERTRSEAALRESEQQLYHSQKMETLGRLAGGVAHDFNNLLTVIIACCEMLAAEREAAGRAPHLQVVEIGKAAERAAALTRQLLAVSRRHVAQPAVLDLNRVVRQTEEMLRRLIGEQVTLAVRLANDLWPIRADRAQLEQILVNLVVNARDAMPGGGRLTIATAAVREAAAGGEERSCELVVSDTGVGMDRETREKVFEPFFTTKEAGRGTGLGLSIVDSLVKQSRGAISIESVPGHGTSFRIRFPATDEALDETHATAAADALAAGRRCGSILLVEDEALVRDVVISLLEPQGYRVLGAGSAGEAMTHLENGRSETFDVVLTDVVLPDRNGFQLAAEVRARFPGVRILFMSGYTDSSVDEKWLEAGTHFLQKPFSADQLLSKLDEVLRSA